MDDYETRMEPGYDPGPQNTRCSICGYMVPAEDIDDYGVCYADDCQEEGDTDFESHGPDYFDAPHFTGEPGFADPGGTSALRAAGPSNPRVHPCPTCGSPDRLTPADVARGYQCDPCADRAEHGGF